MRQFARMRHSFIFALILPAAVSFAQVQPLQIEVANLREDVRGLVQRVGELNLRVEQLERENQALRNQTSAAAESFVTMKMLNDAITDMNRTVRSTAATTKSETLQQVAGQMERLARQTNAAIDSLAKGMASRPPVNTIFTEDYAKEGVSYTVQRGDTLSSIAQKHSARVADITNANKITDPTRIQVGQTLFIPAAK
jgi:LysM repeat protein